MTIRRFIYKYKFIINLVGTLILALVLYYTKFIHAVGWGMIVYLTPAVMVLSHKILKPYFRKKKKGCCN